MKKAGAIVATLLAGCFVCYGQTSNVLKVNYASTSTFNQAGTTASATATTKTEYIAPDGTQRTEIVDNQHHTKTVYISNEAEDYRITINDQKHSATRINGLFSGVKNGTVGTQGTKLDLGKSTIFGYSCEGYENSFPDGAVLRHWVCTDPESGATFNGRTEVTRGASKVEETITDISKVAVPSSLFQVPPGYSLAVTDAKNGVMSFTPMQ